MNRTCNSNKEKSGKQYKRGNNRKSGSNKKDAPELEIKGRDNNPNWYFKDATIAEQVSQLSMRNFLGRDFTLKGTAANDSSVVPAIAGIWFNPSAGHQTVVDDLQSSSINQASFKVYSRLASFTGRALTYQPQDVAMMILAMGEIISMVEWIRRSFGVAYTYSQRNRAYPRQILQVMRIDPDDFFQNYARYRNRFNSIITRINQIPIPKNIAYFDKCASLYEKLYLDSDSPMAQTWITNPYTTWRLNEVSYEQGTILETVQWCEAKTSSTPLSTYLNILSDAVVKLLNSSTLNVVYADLMNYFNKMGGEVWLFDVLPDNYQVIPEFNIKFLMQLHNATVIGVPTASELVVVEGTDDDYVITPRNDVYPSANKNLVYYAPGFAASSGYFMDQILVDFESGQPSVEDRIENTRFTALAKNYYFPSGGGAYYRDVSLPDHYIAYIGIFDNVGGVHYLYTAFDHSDSTKWEDAAYITSFDWHPLMYPSTFDTTSTPNVNTTTPSGVVLGDLNYFTTIDYEYLAPITDFTYLGLFDLF